MDRCTESAARGSGRPGCKERRSTRRSRGRQARAGGLGEVDGTVMDSEELSFLARRREGIGGPQGWAQGRSGEERDSRERRGSPGALGPGNGSLGLRGRAAGASTRAAQP